jgi:hypothetical protein
VDDLTQLRDWMFAFMLFDVTQPLKFPNLGLARPDRGVGEVTLTMEGEMQLLQSARTRKYLVNDHVLYRFGKTGKKKAEEHSLRDLDVR